MENRFVVIVVSLAFVLSILCGCCMIATYLIHRDDRATLQNAMDRLSEYKSKLTETRSSVQDQCLEIERLYRSVDAIAQIAISSQITRKGLTVDEVARLRKALPENQVVLLGEER